jgi:hypothetical protein
MCRKNRKLLPPLILCSALFALPGGAYAQSLESKLAQQTDYLPRAASPVDQLIEVAQRFNIPMAVEWLERPGGESGRAHVPTATPGRRTVRELIADVVGQSPEHRFLIDGGLLYVFPPAVASHPLNFLNIRVGGFHVEHADLFRAEAHLRTKINLALYPELFKRGYGGGYGFPPDHVFTIPNVSVSGEDLNVRDVLNGIAESSGNALWVVRLRADEFTSRRPRWEGKPVDEYGRSPVNGRWHFLPLADVAELAREEVVVELTVEGFNRTERVVIPVLPEHGLSVNESGRSSVSTSGYSYSYAVEVERVRTDAVILKIAFSFQPANGAGQSAEETITVARGEPTELRLHGVGNFRAYIAARPSSVNR